MPLMGHYRIALFYPIKSYQAPQVRLLLPPLFVLGIVFDTHMGKGGKKKSEEKILHSQLLKIVALDIIGPVAPVLRRFVRIYRIARHIKLSTDTMKEHTFISRRWRSRFTIDFHIPTTVSKCVYSDRSNTVANSYTL